MCQALMFCLQTLFCKIGVVRNCPLSTFRILVSWGGGLIGFGVARWVKCNVDAKMAARRLGGLSVMLMRRCFKVSVQRSGAVLRDDTKVFQRACIGFAQGVYAPHIAEAVSIKETLS